MRSGTEQQISANCGAMTGKLASHYRSAAGTKVLTSDGTHVAPTLQPKHTMVGAGEGASKTGKERRTAQASGGADVNWQSAQLPSWVRARAAVGDTYTSS